MDEQLANLLQMLLSRGAVASKPWMSYGGVNTNGPATLIQQLQSQLTSTMTGMLGPLGGLAAPYIGQFVFGKDFNRNGTLNNSLSGLLAPSVGTYAGAFQTMRNDQTLAMLKSSRETLQNNLKEDFYTSYYSLTMGQDRKSQGVLDQVKTAMNNPLSFPSALQFGFDPARNQRIMQGIKNTQAGFLYWADRTGLGSNTKYDRVETARRIGESVSKWAMQANQWQLGARGGKFSQSYGGFSGAQVSQLTSILANASNVFDPQHLQKSITELGDKVKKTAQALAPLKDIFGKDIKAMTDMLQSVSGQNINQMSPAMIRTLANSTVDMARYSGATVTQIAQAGQKIFMQNAQLGGTSFSRIGAANTGSLYAAMTAQGNAPAGVHAAQHAGHVQRTIASAQASAGVDYTAMGYALWEKNVKPGGTIQEYIQQVRKNRTGGRSTLQAVMATAQVKNQTALLRGMDLTAYRVFQQTGAGAQIGVQAQYRSILGQNIAALADEARAQGGRPEAFTALGNFMQNDANAAAIKDLAANANDDKKVRAFARLVSETTGVRVTAQNVNALLRQDGMLSYMSQYGSSMQASRFAQQQQRFRKQTAGLDALGSGKFLAVWRAASAQGADITKGLTINAQRYEKDKNGKDKKVITKTLISQEALKAQTRAIFGTEDLEKAGKSITNLRQTLGKQKTAEFLALASGQFSSDTQFIKNIQNIAAGRDVDQSIGYIQARRAGFLSKNSEFKNKEAKSLRDEALKQYKAALYDRGKNISKKDAQKQLDERLDRAFRIQNLSRMSDFELGGEDGKPGERRKQLIKAFSDKKNTHDNITALLKLGGSRYAEEAAYMGFKGVSKEDLSRIYQNSSINYSKVDVNRMQVTLLQMLIKWLKDNWKAQKPGEGTK